MSFYAAQILTDNYNATQGDNEMDAGISTYRVQCEDGQYRHPQSFGTMDKAKQFAEWGHCCTNVHTIERHDTDGTVGYTYLPELTD